MTGRALTKRRLRLKRDWIGGYVQTRRKMQNGYVVIPAGTICEVTDSYRGLALTSAPCEHCGMQARISRVSEASVDYLGHPQEPSP